MLHKILPERKVTTSASSLCAEVTMCAFLKKALLKDEGPAVILSCPTAHRLAQKRWPKHLFVVLAHLRQPRERSWGNRYANRDGFNTQEQFQAMWSA